MYVPICFDGGDVFVIAVTLKIGQLSTCAAIDYHFIQHVKLCGLDRLIDSVDDDNNNNTSSIPVYSHH